MSVMKLQDAQSNELLFVGFNQDYGCFACGTDTGFKIYNNDPFREMFERDFNKGGIGYVEMLFRCNILALVGGGRNPRYPHNKVMIWDDHQNRCIGELSFRSEVRAVKLRRDRVVVVLEHRIYVYNFVDLRLIDQIETMSNTKGLCALCPYSNNTVLVCPGLETGLVRVELYDIKRTTLIAAHETAIACFALNFDGTRLATASEKGTLIRIYDTLTGQPLQEVRRGADKAQIYSIAFNSLSHWLAVSSDKGTVHIFNIKEACAPKDATTHDNQQQEDHKAPDLSNMPSTAEQQSVALNDGKVAQQMNTTNNTQSASQSHSIVKQNPRSSLSFFKNFLPKYFSSEWSYAQYKVPNNVQNIVAFGAEKNSLNIVCADGNFYKVIFDPHAPNSEMEEESYASFITKK